MADIAQALEGLLDANLEEIEKTHARIERRKLRRAAVTDMMTTLQDDLHQKLKAIRQVLLEDIDADIDEDEALILRLNGQEPPPADVVRFPRSQQMTARAE